MDTTTTNIYSLKSKDPTKCVKQLLTKSTFPENTTYRKTSCVSRTLVGNEIVDNS